MSINGALERSDFYVLVWSAAARDRYWVTSEISAAMVLEQRRARPFVFIVRLDDSELPPVLAPRRYLDAFGGRRQAAADAADGGLDARPRGRHQGPARARAGPRAGSARRARADHAHLRAQPVAPGLARGANSRRCHIARARRRDQRAARAPDGGVGVRRGGGRPLQPTGISTPASSSPRTPTWSADSPRATWWTSRSSSSPSARTARLADPVSFLPGRDYAIPPEMIRELCEKAIEHLLAEGPDDNQDPDDRSELRDTASTAPADARRTSARTRSRHAGSAPTTPTPAPARRTTSTAPCPPRRPRAPPRPA